MTLLNKIKNWFNKNKRNVKLIDNKNNIITTEYGEYDEKKKFLKLMEKQKLLLQKNI